MSGRALTTGVVLCFRGECGTLIRVPVVRRKSKSARSRKIASDAKLKPIPEKQKLILQHNFFHDSARSDSRKTMAAAVASPRSHSLSPTRQGSITPLQRGSVSPRIRTMRPRTSAASSEYDARLDEHQQVYVMSPRMMETLQSTMGRRSGSSFADPKDKIGFHGPRKPLLFSYPISPRHMGRAMFLTTYRRIRSSSPTPQATLPESREGKEAVKVAHHLRTGEFKDHLPGWKKLPRAKTIAPPPTKAVKLAKEKGFVLDGIALSNIQDDFGKVQPKLGPAIPPYNSHYDKHVQNYFTYKGVEDTLTKTGQRGFIGGKLFLPQTSWPDPDWQAFITLLWKGFNINDWTDLIFYEKLADTRAAVIYVLTNEIRTSKVHEQTQTRPGSVSLQGRAVDRFHHIGVGKDYLERRNKSGAGYSSDLVDGHDRFLRDARPMNSYNGKFGFRRNTPTLRHCPSPFGTASRSSTF